MGLLVTGVVLRAYEVSKEKDEIFFLTECIVYFLNTVHCYNILEIY
jgi:hypothetical protein